MLTHWRASKEIFIFGYNFKGKFARAYIQFPK